MDAVREKRLELVEALGATTAVVDMGNTAVKVWVGGEFLSVRGKMPHAELKVLLSGVKRVIWWATREPGPDIVELLGPNRVLGTTPGPLINAYRTPQTLGADRWAAINGAFVWARRENGTAVLVVDAGTALTYDFATDYLPSDSGGFLPQTAERGTYWGGGIGPGLALRYRTLHEHTARLPLLEVENDVDLNFGTDTVGSIRFGAQGAAVLEIAAVIELTAARLPKGALLDVFLTGGDAPFLHKRLQNRNFATRTLKPDLAAFGASLLFPKGCD